MNCKGQAAVTDTIYFLLIVTGLCVFMFSFANNYGAIVGSEVGRQYYIDYSSSALKTILYVSTPRDITQTLSYDPGLDEDVEIDHLSAFIKEDYADDSTLEKNTQITVANTVRNIMRPIADSFDYLFYISVPELAGDRKMIFVTLRISEPGGNSKYWLCKKPFLVEQQEIEALENELGNIYAKSSRILLEMQNDSFGEQCPPAVCAAGFICDNAGPNPTNRCLRIACPAGAACPAGFICEDEFCFKSGAGYDRKSANAQVDFIMWLPTDVSHVFDPSPAGWDCTDIT